MSAPGRLTGIVGLAFAVLLMVVALTWVFDHVIRPPFGNLFAAIIVGLAASEVIKRQPRQRALRIFGLYLRARERGADERAARERLLARLYRDRAVRERVAREVEIRWTGESEKERVLGGVGALLSRERRAIDDRNMEAIYDRVRDRAVIPDWEALPKEFVREVRARLDEDGFRQLDALTDKHRLFQQKFFRAPVSLGIDPEAGVVDLARLLHSLGNHLARTEPGDAERTYLLSLRLRPDDNLAHAGLALLLEQTGRTREATHEAKIALGVLDTYASRAANRQPTTEDISPFRSPKSLREALERVAAAD